MISRRADQWASRAGERSAREAQGPSAPPFTRRRVRKPVFAPRKLGGIIVHSVPFRASRPRGIAAPGDVGEPLTQSPAGMSGPRRNCVAGLPVRAWHVAACIPEAAKAHVRCQLTRRSTWTSVRGDGPYGTLPEAPLTLAVAGSFELPRRRGTGFALK